MYTGSCMTQYTQSNTTHTLHSTQSAAIMHHPPSHPVIILSSPVRSGISTWFLQLIKFSHFHQHPLQCLEPSLTTATSATLAACTVPRPLIFHSKLHTSTLLYLNYHRQEYLKHNRYNKGNCSFFNSLFIIQITNAQKINNNVSIVKYSDILRCIYMIFRESLLARYSWIVVRYCRVKFPGRFSCCDLFRCFVRFFFIPCGRTCSTTWMCVPSPGC